MPLGLNVAEHLVYVLGKKTYDCSMSVRMAVKVLYTTYSPKNALGPY